MSSFTIDDDRRITVGQVSVSPDHYIGGVRVPSVDTFETRSPMDWDTVLADVARGNADTAKLAVSAAVEGFEVWSNYSRTERSEVMHKMADLIEANNDEIAFVETLDMAFLYESMRLRLVARGAANFRLYADLATQHEERTWSGRGGAHVVQSAPAGPAVIITPWNAPFMLSTWKLSPALAAGNSIILKPAEWSPCPLHCSPTWQEKLAFRQEPSTWYRALAKKSEQPLLATTVFDELASPDPPPPHATSAQQRQTTSCHSPQNSAAKAPLSCLRTPT